MDKNYVLEKLWSCLGQNGLDKNVMQAEGQGNSAKKHYKILKIYKISLG